MADVELLPLPAPFVSDLVHGDLYTPEQVRAYARANLAPLQAENEQLRTEVDGWKAQHSRDSAELRRLCQHRDEYKARAERLAKTLRSSANVLERLAFAIRAPNVHTPQLVELAIAMRAAALAQEDRND